MSRPRTTGAARRASGSAGPRRGRAGTTGTRWSFGSSKPIRFLPGIGATMRTLRARREREIVGEPRDLRDLGARGRRDLVRRHGRAREDVLDLALHAVVRQRLDERLRVRQELVPIDGEARIDLLGDEQVDARAAGTRTPRFGSLARVGLLLLERRRRVDDGRCFADALRAALALVAAARPAVTGALDRGRDTSGRRGATPSRSDGTPRPARRRLRSPLRRRRHVDPPSGTALGCGPSVAPPGGGFASDASARAPPRAPATASVRSKPAR